MDPEWRHNRESAPVDGRATLGGVIRRRGVARTEVRSDDQHNKLERDDEFKAEEILQ
jgi:hypothetical protein